MKTKTLWQITSVSLCAIVVACGGQAVDVGSNQGGEGGTAGANGKATGSGADPGTGAVGATGTGAVAATGAGAAAATGSGAAAGTTSGPDPSGVGSNGNVIGPEPPNCDASTYPAGDPPAEWPAPESCQTGSSSLQGTWRGYVQGLAAGLYPNEGNFTLSLQGDDGALCGSVIFGDPVELPPVTDPKQGYLVEGGMYIGLQALKGFAYTLLDIQVSGERVTFGISLAEPYGAWCAQQTPYYDVKNDLGWNCARNLSTVYQENQCFLTDVCSEAKYEVDCLHQQLCTDLSKPCACNADGCAADVNNQGPRFDLRFETSEAEGQLNDSLVFLQRE